MVGEVIKSCYHRLIKSFLLNKHASLLIPASLKPQMGHLAPQEDGEVESEGPRQQEEQLSQTRVL